MKLEITISLDNAAFTDDTNEIGYCLKQVNDRATLTPGSGKIHDSNRNTVGGWKVYAENPIESGN